MRSSLSGTVPFYWQLANEIFQGIQQGNWAPGDRLPSERALCEQFQVSQITVRRALRELAHQSRVYSRHGLGWFVAEPATATGGRAPGDVLVISPSHDAFVDAVVRACVHAFCIQGQGVQVLYPAAGAARVPLPDDLAGTPMLWVVDGRAEGLVERYARLLDGHFDQSLLLVRPVEGLPVPALQVDERAAMAQMVEHLVDQGCQRIAYVGSDPREVAGWRRYQGYAEAIWSHGLELPMEWVFSVVSGEIASDERFPRVMEGDRRPTAIACSTDGLAVEVMARLASMGLSCPGDVAVVGLGDEPLVAYLPKPLTTFRFDLASLAAQAVQAVSALREGRALSLEPITGQVIIRDTCGARLRRPRSSGESAVQVGLTPAAGAPEENAKPTRP